jgi:radical SAM protein with 4Fe4S-binding SPASM domain
MLDIKLKLKPGHSIERVWMAPSPLRVLFWNLTYACNFHCDICFTDAGKAQKDELTTAEALDFLRQTAQAGVRDMLISGGEPFLRQDILTILSRMADLGLTARIASNGSLLTAGLLAQLKRETLTKSFQVSLDTIDPSLYPRLHGTSAETLPLVLDNLRLIRDCGFHTTASVRLTPETLPGIPGLLDFASREGWATVTIHCPVHTRRIRDALPQDEDFLSLLQPVFDHFCRLPQHWLIETYIPWAEYHPVMRKLGQKVRVVHRGCAAGRDRLTVSPAGWLSPCICLDVPSAYIGNIRRDDLNEIFEQSPLCRMMRCPGDYGICLDCPNLGRCGGGCRAAAFSLTGRLDGQDKSCPVWKQQQPKVVVLGNDR